MTLKRPGRIRFQYAKGVPFLRSIEVQVLDHGHGSSDSYTTHGDVFPIWGATMMPDRPHPGGSLRCIGMKGPAV